MKVQFAPKYVKGDQKPKSRIRIFSSQPIRQTVVGGYYLQGIGESIGVVIVRVDIVLACCCTNKRKYLSK